MWSPVWAGGALVAIILVGIVCWRLVIEAKESQRISLLIQQLIARAQSLGLPERDVNNAADMLEAAEYGLAFDIVIEQLYEHSIQIDVPFYHLAATVAGKMEIPEQHYVFVKKLIK